MRTYPAPPILRAAFLACAAVWLSSQALSPSTNAAPAQPNRVRLGLLLPPDEPERDSIIRGTRLALESVKGDRHYDLIVRGRIGQWGDDGVEAARMALDDGVAGLITPASGAAAHLTLQVSGRTGLPVATLCGDSSVVGAGIPWMLQIHPGTLAEAGLLFRHGHALGITNWTAIVPAGRAGREAIADLRSAGAAANAAIARVIEFTTNTSSLGAAAEPDALGAGLALWLDPASAGHAIRLLARQRAYPIIVGPGHLQSAAFLHRAGANAEGLIVAAPPESLESAAFAASFRRQHADPPPYQALLAADAALALVRAIVPGLRAPKPLRASNLGQGYAGPLQFDAEGRRQLALALWRCTNGAFLPLDGSP